MAGVANRRLPGRPFPCEPLKAPAQRKRVAARVRTGRPRLNSVAMDVGADEFEQSLPLLQELVLGAEFVGKGGDSGPCRRIPPARASLRRVWPGRDREQRGEAQPGRSPGRGRPKEGPPTDRDIPPGAWAVGR